jgi:hypothetical protein
MKLTAAELAYVRSQGLYLTEKCNGCRKLLNQTARYTIASKSEVYCSAMCRDFALFGDLQEVKKRSSPGRCVYCGASLEGKRRGALYCDEICMKRAARRMRPDFPAQSPITGTLRPANQGVTDAKIA